MAGLVLALCSVRADQKTKTLDVVWADSEGGGSTLLITPAGESVLIDTGNPGGRDAGRIVKAAKEAGLTRIDHILITHFHRDHIGGAAEIAAAIPVGTLWERTIPDSDPDGNAASPWALQSKPYREMTVGKREHLTPGVVIPLKQADGAAKLEIRCLVADQKFVAPTEVQAKTKNPLAGSSPAKELKPSDNDNSAGFLISFGAFRFFDGGDLTWNFEDKLVSPINLVGTVDLYQTDHHGLDVSNNPILIQSLAPTVVVMNNGPRKGGLHGAFAAIASAKSVQARFQVHKSMNSPEDNAPDAFIANLEEARPPENCPGNVIKLSVTPDAKHYTVSVPARGTEKKFDTTAK